MILSTDYEWSWSEAIFLKQYGGVNCDEMSKSRSSQNFFVSLTVNEYIREFASQIVGLIGGPIRRF